MLWARLRRISRVDVRGLHLNFAGSPVIVLFAIAACVMSAQSPDVLQAARQAMDARQYPEAEQFYRKALAQAPSSASVETDLGLSLQLQGRSAEAIHFFSLALKQGYVPETYALLAQEKCRMGDLDGLRPMLARIYRDERKNLRVIAAVAPCYLDIDEPVESTVVYQTLANSKDFPPDLALVQLAKSYIRSGQLFTTKLSKLPGSEPFLDAFRHASEDGSTGARSAFPKAAKRSTYFNADLDWQHALSVWQQHPQDAALLYLLAVLSGEQGMKQIQLCDEQYPGSAYLEQFHADVLADQGHTDEAAAEYEELMRVHPDLSDLRYSLGLLREKREEWQLASQAFHQQLTAYPTDERAAAHWSKCLLELQQYEEVKQFLESRMHDDHSSQRTPQWAILNLAEAQEKLGKPEDAVQTLVAAEHGPAPGKLVHFRLTHLYSITGHPADAKREYALFQAASSK